MNVDDLIIVSVDDHVVEPPSMFEKHLPAAYRDTAPRFFTEADGSGYWLFEGKKIPNIGLNAVAGRVPEEYGCEPQSLEEMRAGAYDIHARIGDMNVNGILGSICFGSFAGFEGALYIGAKDKQNALAVIRAYNDWHIDEWCGAYPGRFIPMALLPLWDVALCVQEVKRVVAKGCRAVTFPDNPAARGLASIHDESWEAFWRICAEEEVVICCHIGTGSAPAHPSMDSPIDAWIIGMPMAIANSAADWLHLTALKRYPKLKIALSEGGIGWVPYFLERAEFTHQQHKAWTFADFGDRTPTQVFQDHFLTCFIDDKFGVANRHKVGLQTICYECDYPHSDATWPRSPERLFENFVGVPDDEIDAMTHLNAMRAFHYDPFAIFGRENCTVGALRAQAQHIDITPRSFNAGKPKKSNGRSVVTSGDVLKLFQHEDA